MFGNMMEGYCWCFYNRFYITVSYKDVVCFLSYIRKSGY